MQAIRVKLGLTDAVWKALPDELLAIAFRPASVQLARKEKQRLEELYGTADLEQFEYLGDAV